MNLYIEYLVPGDPDADSHYARFDHWESVASAHRMFLEWGCTEVSKEEHAEMLLAFYRERFPDRTWRSHCYTSNRMVGSRYSGYARKIG